MINFYSMQVLHASMLNHDSGELYNVADDAPASRSEVELFVRSLLTTDTTPSDTSAAKTFSTGKTDHIKDFNASLSPRDEKRVCSGKAKQLVGDWDFPTYRHGLEAIWNGDLSPFREILA